MSNFASRLKQLRHKQELTQKELAISLNVSQNAVFNWENNKREPSIEMLKRIATYFGVSLGYLTGIEDNPKIPFWVKAFAGNIDEQPIINATTKELVDKALGISHTDLLSKYDKLNQMGKQEAIKRVQELTEIKRYTVPDAPSEQRTAAPAVPDVEDTENLPDHLILNAAHARTDIEVTDEMRKHDDDIMNDDKLWK